MTSDEYLKKLIETYRRETNFTDYDVEMIAKRYANFINNAIMQN